MTFTKKQNEDLCVAAGIAPVDYIGKAVECTTCKCTKKPRGRSAPLYSSYCDTDCSGYYEEPLSGDLWWDETGTDFGYSFSKERATPIYPDLLTAEGFLILLEALRLSGWYVKEISDRSFGEPEETNDTSWLFVFEKPNSRNAWEYSERFSKEQCGWGNNLREAGFRAASYALGVPGV